MRKSLILAALIAATAAPPVIAQESPQDRGGPTYERSGGRDGGRQGEGRGNRQAPQPAPQPGQQAAPQTQAPAAAPQARTWQGRGARVEQGGAQGGMTTRAPGADRPAWRGDRENRGANPGGNQPTPPAVTERQSGRTDGGWTRNYRNGQNNGNVQNNWNRNERGDQARGNDLPRDGNRGNTWNGNERRDQARGNDWPRDGNRADRNWDNQGDRARNNLWRNQGNSQAWNRDWRRDQRYDWQRYRTSNRNLYRAPRYYAPYGYGNGYQRFSIGIYLGNPFFSEQYWLDDPYDYRLPPAYGPYRWVRYYDDVLLVDIRNGYVVDVIHDFFW